MNKLISTGKSLSKDPVLMLWILFLSCILIPAAIVVNFDLGDSRLKSQLADYIANTPASTATNPTVQP